eukprot:scpid48913/ scgid23302/ Lysophospholipid acyltransferase 7; Leukocyte receptor cluster member 4; Membrane-bound O-acyltransferase domain-containing protein 7
MDQQDVIYLAVLVASILLAHIFRLIPQPGIKQVFGGIIGFSIAVLVCGWQVYHSLITASINYIFIRHVSTKYNHILSFVFCFAYIGFTRVSFLLGLEPIGGHTNVIQLILTVKLVSLAFDIRDRKISQESNKKDEDSRTAIFYRDEYDSALLGFKMPTTLPLIPDIVEYYCFVYCFVGLLTGPFFRISTFRHAVWRPNAGSLPTLKPSLLRLAPFPLYAGITFIFAKYFPHAYLGTDEYGELPYVHRILYVVPAFIGYRYRYYTGWSLAEAAIVASGVGAYPVETKPEAGQGPTQPLSDGKSSGQLDFSAVYNLDVYRIETATDMRTAIRHWNMSVQWWMTYYIYKRFPSKSLRFPAVWFTSAYWHGVRLGYYLCFMSTVLTSLTESTWWKATAFLRKKGPMYERAMLVIGWFLCFRYFEHLAVGFMLQHPSIVFKSWSYTYFFGHSLAICVLVLAMLLTAVVPPEKKKE